MRANSIKTNFNPRGAKPMNMPEEVIKLINDPSKVKTMTTVDKEGNPHSVPVGSMTFVDGHIAFMELLDTGKTQKNMLNCYWFDKEVSVVVIDDWEKGKVYQIKGAPYKYLRQGPIWDTFCERMA